MKILNFRDVLIVVLVALVFSLIYKFNWFLYYALKPVGFQLENVIYGLWFMAGTIAMLLIRKPGAALLAEMTAGLLEAFLAGGVGIQSFVYGFFQGLASEIVFLLFQYRKFTLGVTVLAAIFPTILSLLIDHYYGYLKLELWALNLTVIFRTIGAILLAGYLAYQLVKTLNKIGLTPKVYSDADKNLLG